MKKINKIVAGALAAALTLSMGSMFVACGGSAQDYTFEAEDAVLADPDGAQTRLSVESGFEWAGFDEDGGVVAGETDVTQIGFFGSAADQTITWNIKSDKNCEATLTLRAASCAQSGNIFLGEPVQVVAMNVEDAATLEVNGTEVAFSGELPGIEGEFTPPMMGQLFTFGLKNFGTVSVKINLKSGDNTVVIRSIGGANLNIDKITINASAKLTFEKTDNSDRGPAQMQ